MTREQVSREVVREAIAALHGSRTRYVGIDGFGASGKTSLARWLEAGLDDCAVIHVDDFAGPQIAEWDWQRLFEQVLEPLQAGRPGRYQRWDWTTDSGREWHEVTPGSLLLIEGVSCTRREVDVAWDLTVWVEASAELRRARALARDGAAMWATWQQRWIPPEQAYAARERPWERADLVVNAEEPENSDDTDTHER